MKPRGTSCECGEEHCVYQNKLINPKKNLRIKQIRCAKCSKVRMEQEEIWKLEEKDLEPFRACNHCGQIYNKDKSYCPYCMCRNLYYKNKKKKPLKGT